MIHLSLITINCLQLITDTAMYTVYCMWMQLNPGPHLKLFFINN